VSAPVYHALSPEQLPLLLAPENADAKRAWSELRGALSGIISMLSVTYPRPLYYYEDAARRDLLEQPERLRGTPFHAAAVQNVQAAEEIERMFQTEGHTPELHATADRFIDALLDEFNVMRLYPEIPPPRDAAEENGLANHRAVAGR
jgi:hypothetical protein